MQLQESDASSMGRSGAGVALSRCPELRKGPGLSSSHNGLVTRGELVPGEGCAFG